MASTATGAGHPANAATAAAPVELLGPVGSGFVDVLAPQAEAFLGAGSPAHATPSGKADRGWPCGVLAPRSAQLAIVTPMEQCLEDQELKELLKMLGEFAGTER